MNPDTNTPKIFSFNLLTKISQFELSGVTDEKVLWFQVTMEDVPLMDVRQASQQLEEEKLKKKTQVTLSISFLCRINLDQTSQLDKTCLQIQTVQKQAVNQLQSEYM